MMDHPTDLEASIVRTLCWFSLFDYPMTSFEIWKWLLEPSRAYDLFEVYRVLNLSSWVQNRYVCDGGFYSLKDGKDHRNKIEGRHEKFLDAVRKFQKLKRASLYFQFVPGVQAVAAVNTLAWWQTHPTSDIDLFIVTKPGLIWSTRFYLVLPFAILGQRPTQHHLNDDVQGPDPFCFSFFSTRDSIQMEGFKFKKEDPYLCFWSKSLVPIIDRDNCFREFANVNRWIDKSLPNSRLRKIHHTHRPTEVKSIPIQFRLFEPFFRSVQRRRFPKIIKDLANKDTRVIINDQVLKFHENDRREEYARSYAEKLQQYL